MAIDDNIDNAGIVCNDLADGFEDAPEAIFVPKMVLINLYPAGVFDQLAEVLYYGCRCISREEGENILSG
jgi:hypothetical protein